MQTIGPNGDGKCAVTGEAERGRGRRRRNSLLRCNDTHSGDMNKAEFV